MKKIINIICCHLLLWRSGNGAERHVSKGPKNLESNDAIRKMYAAEVLIKWDYISTDAVDHGGGNSAIKRLADIVKEMMPDMKYEVVNELPDDDQVFPGQRYRARWQEKI